MNHIIINEIAEYLQYLVEQSLGITAYSTEGEFLSSNSLPAIVISFSSHTSERYSLAQNKRKFTYNLKIYVPISGGAQQAEIDTRGLVCKLINSLEKKHVVDEETSFAGLLDSGEMLISSEEQPYRVYSCNLTATVISCPVYEP